ncbi:MAG: hypothetical protein PHP85_03360 [Gallionella sp.]|nr:hypothetical protein [Gallionella sp.]
MHRLDSFRLKTAVPRICLCLVLASITAALHAAQSMENILTPDPAMTTLQHTEPRALYRINPNRAFTMNAAARPSAEFPGAQADSLWATSAHWKITQGNNLALFKPQLSFETKDQRFEIKPRRRSLMVEWRKSF